MKTNHAITHSEPIDRLLDRLDQVKQSSPEKWRAKCPVHQDETSKSRTLSIKETEIGSVLLHCFAGCDVDSITNAVGLQVSDLFPKEEYIQHAKYATRPRKDLKAIIDRSRMAVTIVEIAARHIADGKEISEADLWIVRGASSDLREMLDV